MKKISIIDEDANMLFALQAKFNILGHVTKIFNGQQIEEITNELLLEQPDFIVLELNLNQIDGFDLLKKIKNNDQLLNIPIIIFSNLPDSDYKEKSLNFGASHYFNKNDFYIDDFILKFDKIMANRLRQSAIFPGNLIHY
jgi:DNA-binding response OmpR family regulator